MSPADATPPPSQFVVPRIVSGGQTGADRAALDWAIEHGVPHGGYCPKGRLADDGPIPDRYQLIETRSKSYPPRTERNVVESDATLIFSCTAKLSGGSNRTADFADQHGKPWLHVWATAPMATTVDAVRAFITDHGIAVLNVAGPRESKEPEVGAFVREVLTAAFIAERK